jgi:hypothetical protein
VTFWLIFYAIYLCTEIVLYIIIGSWNRPELFELLRHPRRGMHGQVYNHASREVTTPTCVDVISISRCRVWLTPWSFHDPRYCWGMGLMEMRGEDASRWLEKPHREERSIVNHTDKEKVVHRPPSTPLRTSINWLVVVARPCQPTTVALAPSPYELTDVYALLFL